MTSDEAAKEHKAAYLGDGVYAALEYGRIVLTVNSHYGSGNESNAIWLEPEVYASLLRYVKRLEEEAATKRGQS